jgi:hypothetical protein
VESHIPQNAPQTIKFQELLDSQKESPPSQSDIKIINLSHRDLSGEEINLLEKGMKFSPKPRKNDTDLIKDTEEFCRKLPLKEFFSKQRQRR